MHYLFICFFAYLCWLKDETQRQIKLQEATHEPPLRSCLVRGCVLSRSRRQVVLSSPCVALYASPWCLTPAHHFFTIMWLLLLIDMEGFFFFLDLLFVWFIFAFFLFGIFLYTFDWNVFAYFGIFWFTFVWNIFVYFCLHYFCILLFGIFLYTFVWNIFAYFWNIFVYFCLWYILYPFVYNIFCILLFIIFLCTFVYNIFAYFCLEYFSILLFGIFFVYFYLHYFCLLGLSLLKCDLLLFTLLLHDFSFVWFTIIRLLLYFTVLWSYFCLLLCDLFTVTWLSFNRLDGTRLFFHRPFVWKIFYTLGYISSSVDRHIFTVASRVTPHFYPDQISPFNRLCAGFSLREPSFVCRDVFSQRSYSQTDLHIFPG